MPKLPLIARRQAAKIGAGLSFAVATGASAAEPLPDPSVPPSQVAGVPVPPGQIDEAIAKLDGLIKDLLGRSGVPGLAVAVVRDGKTVYAKGFGVRKTGTTDAVDADTVFFLASV